ncbi:MAG: 30S ribosomal protein S11 [Planctomycetes bacterium]|nr:30S ribosomal protein S11 [Planctomycetota bacterium]
MAKQAAGAATTEQAPAAAAPAPVAKEGGAKEGGSKEGGSGSAGSKEKKAARKIKRNVPRAVVYVKSTFNNTIVTVTDLNGDTIAWDSAGSMGFKGSRKGTPFAAQRAGENVAEKIKKMGVREVEVLVQGPGAGRESAVRSMQGRGIEVKSIEDITPLPHNGCRPKKKRRV